ncbi:hypothetical protein [Sulfitobacter sp.]|uniref:hypothetical protein n=1 Tax=Sulfitobacter sp. TaxID=1903071 RepID=UPI0030035695
MAQHDTGEGIMQKSYTRKITRSIKGADVTRDGSDDDPALFHRTRKRARGA